MNAIEELTHRAIAILSAEKRPLSLEDLAHEMEVAGDDFLLPDDEEERWVLLWKILHNHPRVEMTCAHEVVQTVEEVHRFSVPFP